MIKADTKLSAFAAALLTLGLLAGATPAAAQGDPVSQDPPLLDRAHPPAMLEIGIDSHGSRLNAILYLAQGPGPHPTVVLLHGFPGNEKNLDLAQALRRAGFNVLFFHYRGSWGSPGSYSFAHCLEDVESALAYLRSEESRTKRRVDPRRIALVGHSLGGFLALQTAASNDSIRCAVSLAGVDLGARGKAIATHPELREAMITGLDAGTGPLAGTSGEALFDEVVAHADAWDLVSQAPALARRRLLLIGGYRDTAVPLAGNHEPLAAALRAIEAPHVSELVLDSDHAFSGHRIALARALVAWFREECGW